MTATSGPVAKTPSRILVRTFWMLHRAMYRVSGGRFGLSRPEAGARFGMMRLSTIGRRSGQRRMTMVGYYPDGANLVTLAMNGWADAEPAWWLNLQAHPDATVVLPDGPRAVSARAAGAEHVALAAEYAGTARGPARTAAREALDSVGLADRAGHRPMELSGGEQQRAAIARALVNHPTIVLGDEPTGNLDSARAGEVLGLLRTFNRERGQTVLLVTHDADVGASCDRMIRMRDGLIVRDERIAPIAEPDPVGAPQLLPGYPSEPAIAVGA